MAKVIVQRAKVEPAPPPPIERVVLELSEAEADTLGMVLRRIGGDPEASRRRHTDAVLRALRDAGVAGAKDRNVSPITPKLSSLHFSNEPGL